MVVAFARLVRSWLLEDGETVRVAVMDHLLDRLTEARTGLIALPVLDVVDRLHGELTHATLGSDPLGSSGDEASLLGLLSLTTGTEDAAPSSGYPAPIAWTTR